MRPVPPGRWLTLGMLVALGVGFALILGLTQTDRGREEVLAYTLGALGGRLNGQLVAERLAGNVLTGARLYGISLHDHDGQPLLVADSVYIQYRIGTLIGGDVVITRLDLFDAEVTVFRMPEDTVWNYQEILRDPTPDPLAPARATLIQRLGLNDTRITIRAPWEPNDLHSAARQEEAVREVLAPDSRWIMEEVPGGYVRTILIDVASGAAREIFIGPDERGGVYLEVDDVLADVRLWRDPPLEVRAATARLHLQNQIVNFEAPRLTLPNTTGEAVGRIDLTGDRPLYDVALVTPQFALADLRWLYPWLPDVPEEGGGSARVWLEDRPEGLLVVTRDLVVAMPGTRVTGRFGLIAGETLRFVDVDLEADPLRVESVEQLLPAGIPVEGLTIGGAVIRGES